MYYNSCVKQSSMLEQWFLSYEPCRQTDPNVLPSHSSPGARVTMRRPEGASGVSGVKLEYDRLLERQS